MANKLLLVPEAMYHGLTASAAPGSTTTTSSKIDNADDDNMNLDFVRKNLERTKKRRIRNLSKKNVEYNQELRRFLKLRKEQKDKPIRVKLDNGKFSIQGRQP